MSSLRPIELLLLVVIFVPLVGVTLMVRRSMRRRRSGSRRLPPAPAGPPPSSPPSPSPPAPNVGRGKVFISYRRADTEADAGRLYSDLAAEFGAETLFKDVDNVPLGADVRSHISAAMAQASVVLVLVGPNWDPQRLGRDDDWIRIEIEEAFAHDRPVIPVRLRRAELPKPSEVPPSLSRFCGLNAAELEHGSWHRDLAPLMDAVRQHRV